MVKKQMVSKRKIFPLYRIHSLNLAKQNLWINKCFPQFIFHEEEQHWVGKLISSYQKQSYTVKIVYNRGNPKVFITHPGILRKCPHMYTDNSLCLYYPPDKSYKVDKIIAKTIIPWTCEWLYYYEVWYETGVWWGPEAPHRINSARGKKITRKMMRGIGN
ncbi:hypothetical protein P4H83_06720 [Paenibacillus favisporus]|uniref:hypothetical protein n=1 Tax=Paenibacillus favisporus TaxID=221028 RepID=UPI002DBB3ED7|nr:hypothetical protein [Paenibacillus favisporus]MEC0174563.1 hypothetical protein [Paenibacillus favisporus]